MGFSSSWLSSSSDDLSDLMAFNGDAARELFSGVLMLYTDDSLSTCIDCTRDRARVRAFLRMSQHITNERQNMQKLI